MAGLHPNGGWRISFIDLLGAILRVEAPFVTDLPLTPREAPAAVVTPASGALAAARLRPPTRSLAAV